MGKTEQELFFEELRRMQDFVIGVSLCKQDKYKNTEEMLEDVTYEAICRMCAIIDGYGNNSTKYKYESGYGAEADGIEMHLME